MTAHFKFPIFAAACTTLLCGTLISLAGVAGVQDDAGFFSETAKADANYNIRELQKSMKKDVCVETFKEIPADVKQGVNLQDKAAANRMFEQWALKRARLQSVNGVYLLLVKEPSHLQVEVGNDTQKQAFTLADRDGLVRTMLAKLRAKDNDAALREGISFVASTMKSHAPSHVRPSSAPAPLAGYRQSSPPESSGGWILPLLIIGVVIWLGLALVRSLFRGGMSSGAGVAPGAPGAMPGASGGGGGFFRNMLGGMFGAAAGMWMYDSFFGSRGSSSYGAPPEDRLGSGGGDSGFTGQDTDYSGSGGSFGDDSGGGDSGGGFGGGGDSGGGDSGGGGDF